MNRYKAASIAVAAIAGVCGGSYTAFALGGDAAEPPVVEASVASVSPSPEEAETPTPSPTPEESASPETATDPETSEPTSTATTPDAPAATTEADSGDNGSGDSGSGDTGGGSMSRYLGVTVDQADRLGSGDPHARPLLVTVTVCANEIPSGDADGKIDVRQNDFHLDETGPDAYGGAPWDGFSWEIIGDDEAFPRLVSLSQGECASGILPFLAGVDVTSTTLTFQNDYSDTLKFDL